jgi:hypothetical protein
MYLYQREITEARQQLFIVSHSEFPFEHPVSDMHYDEKAFCWLDAILPATASCAVTSQMSFNVA